MKRPENYDNVAVTGGWQPLTVGGHELIILGVEEKESKTGREMLVVYFDTSATDSQPAYYMENHTEGKYYGGTHYVVLGEEEWAIRNLKTLIQSAEKSNEGFTFLWEKPDCLKGKKIGGVFREEEYLNDEGEVRTSVKLSYFCTTDRLATVQAPKKKELPESQKVVETEDEQNDSGLPFDL